MKTKVMTCAVAVFTTLALSAADSQAASKTYTVVTGDPAVLNHYPGPDGLVGTTDDVISAANTTFSNSLPNSIASYSYNAFDFGSHLTDPALPSTFNAVTFLQGTVSIDTAIATSGGGPLLTGFDFMGTEPFAGHGPYEAVTTAINSGTYNTATHAMTINIDMQATLNGGTGTSTNFDMSGEAYVIDAADFGAASGNVYVDNVLIPAAIAHGAQSLVYFSAAGTVPADSSGNFLYPSMPVRSEVFAITVPEPAVCPC